MTIEPDKTERDAGSSGVAAVHVYSNQAYDESEVWCMPGEPSPFVTDADGKHIEPTTEPEKSTCRWCLLAIAKFGHRASERRQELLDAEVVAFLRSRRP